MKIIFFLIAIALFGCEQKQVSRVNSASMVNKKITLKDLTTGEKASQSVIDGHLGKWSYFGKERVVTTEALSDGTISSATILMDGGDGFDLQLEMESKFTKEEGRKIYFDCERINREIPELNNVSVIDSICKLSHKKQILTMFSTNPNDSKSISIYYNALPLIYSTKITLVDTDLVLRGKAELEKAEADKRKITLENARKDL
jgi:hypothetical protein